MNPITPSQNDPKVGLPKKESENKSSFYEKAPSLITPMEASTANQIEAVRQQPLEIPKQVPSEEMTPLSRAVELGDLNAVRELIRDGVDLNAKNNDGRTPLLMAAQSGELEILQELLRAGADVNLADRFDTTPISWAVQLGEFEIVKALIQAKADLNFANFLGKTPIGFAVMFGRIEILKVLVAARAEAEGEKSAGEPMIFRALDSNNLEILKEIIKAGANLNVKDSYGRTPLMVAVQRGDITASRVLIRGKADVNLADDEGTTPLMYAAWLHRGEIVQELIQAGAKGNGTLTYGKTLIIAAIENKDFELAKALIRGKIDINVPDQLGKTPLLWAVELGDFELIKELVRAGAKDDVALSNRNIERNCSYLLTDVVESKDFECLKGLIQAGVTPDATLSDGRTLLKFASETGNLEILKSLIDQKPQCLNSNYMNIEGQTPLYIAIGAGHFDVARELISLGAWVNQPNLSGSTPIIAAAWSGNVPFLKELIQAGANVNATESGSSVLYIIKMIRPKEFREIVDLLIAKSPALKILGKEQVYRTQLAHAWHLKGTTSLINKDSGQVVLSTSLEGARVPGQFHQMCKDLKLFAETYPELNSPLFKALGEAVNFSSTVKTNEEIFNRIEMGLPTFVSTGYKNHEVTLLIWKDQLVICNRGGASRHPLEIFHIDPKSLNLELIKTIGEESKKFDSEAYKKLFFEELPVQLSFSQTPLDSRLQNATLLSEQEVGNCTWLSPMTAIYAMLLIGGTNEKSAALSSQINSQVELYRTWLRFEQISTLERIMKLLPQEKTPFQTDHFLIQNAIRRAYLLVFDPQLTKRLEQLIETYMGTLESEELTQFKTDLCYWKTVPLWSFERGIVL